MERSEVIAAAAQRLRAQHLTGQGGFPPALAFVRDICAACQFLIQPRPRTDVMLDGAHARLQFWSADEPAMGGMIWVAEDMWRGASAFAAYAVAHELGHFVLHCGERRAIFRPCDGDAVSEDGDDALLHQRPQSVEEYAPEVRREREANLFAAELLAPRAEVRRLFTRERLTSEAIAARLGITPTLAERRLLGAVLAPSRPREDPDLIAPSPTSETPATALLDALDPHQQAAAVASGPALVVAGPGTGKTATLIGRAAHLLTARGRAPEEVLALTFSNAAAGEMRERLMRVGLPGERMPVMTIHSFAATLLREYASRVPCAAGEAPLRQDFRLLDQADQYLLLEELLPDLPLHYYRALGQPTRHLPTLITDFSAARDALLTPEAYVALVEAMPLAPDAEGGADEDEESARSVGGRAYTRVEQARARERAVAYGVYDRALRARGLVDFGGLIQRAVELLLADELVLAEVRRRYPEVLVDEFQDTNHAAGELILLLAGAGEGLWVVGDANQSIYRWRGASPRNLDRLQERFPRLATYRLLRCYRSVPEIVALASHMAEVMYDRGVASGAISSTAPKPVALQPNRASNRPDSVAPARAVALANGEAEHAYLARSIQAARASGHAYRDQALLCATHKQVREVAAALDAAGVPVAMVGDVFARDEVKDALCLLRLAAGSDGGPLVRVEGLLRVVGSVSPPRAALIQVARAFSRASSRAYSQGHGALPYALATPEAVRQALAPGRPGLPVGADVMERAEGAPTAALVSSLVALGQVATRLRHHETVGLPLARALVAPGGYAWRLACQADGVSGVSGLSGVSGVSVGADEPGALAPGEAQTALAALGALVSLALSFDRRWMGEPDFRARLSQATRQGTTGFARATPPTPLDALESPTADVAQMAQMAPDAREPASMPEQSGARHQSEPALAVTAFLHYLNALRAASVRLTVPAPEEDTVRVMTLHASKGLEFEVVYLPYLVQGRFPAKKGGHQDASPPGFREADAPGQEEAEQRCLFYVGVTRARDGVVLTRAERYDAKATRSPLLALVDGAATLATLESNALPSDVGGAVALAEEDEPVLAASHFAVGAPLPTFALWELNLYNECPRKYKYARHYGFYDADQGAVLRFHHFVRRGQRVLREARTGAAGQPGTPFETVAPRLQAAWQEDGPIGHAYEAYYWRHAEAILRQEWDALVTTTPGSMGTIAREVTATLRRCRVTVTADELIEEAGATPGARRITVVRQRTGLPAKSHRDDLALPLYVLALRAEQPGADVRVVLRYLGNALRSDDPGEQQGETVDLTEEATRAASRYMQPDRKARSTLDKLDEAAERIQAGLFPPHPEERRCAECAFAYLCPADPADAPVALTGAHSRTMPSARG